MELLLSVNHIGRRVLLRCGTYTIITGYFPGAEYPIITPTDRHRVDGVIDMGRAYSVSGQTAFDIVAVLPD